MVLCAGLVSLSEVFSPSGSADAASIVAAEEKMPVWCAVLVSFTMPLACTFFVIVIKY